MTHLRNSGWRISRRTLVGACAGSVPIAFRELAAAPVDARARRSRRRRAHAQVAPPIDGPAPCDATATSGISGLVLIGPMCPVVTVDDPCPD